MEAIRYSLLFVGVFVFVVALLGSMVAFMCGPVIIGISLYFSETSGLLAGAVLTVVGLFGLFVAGLSMHFGYKYKLL